jgi:alanine racemase
VIPDEGVELRQAGIDAPILVLDEPDAWDDLVAHGLTPTVYSERGIAALAAEAERQRRTVGVHLKADTGMHRIGVVPADAVHRAKAVLAAPPLRLDAVWTHCPVADEPANPFTEQQADRFDGVLAELRAAGIDPPMVHAANSAAALVHPRLRYDLVRCGIAVYGLDPSPDVRDAAPLRPALTWKSRVSNVQAVATGEAVSYGLRRPVAANTVIATVPVGYADGMPRRMSDEGAVLIGGKRRPIAGTITMDRLMVDCGDDDVAAGAEVVLIGEQGPEAISVQDWADLAGTIVYEITCGINPRVPRVHL